MSKTLAEVNANQNMQKSTSPIGEHENDIIDNDNFECSTQNDCEEGLKPSHSRKRKLDEVDFAKQPENTPLPKKRKLSAKSLEDKDENEDPDKISMDRKIGLNEGEIENSLQKLSNMEK